MKPFKAAVVKLWSRVKQLSLVEKLLIALLLSSLVNGSRERDIDTSLHEINNSLSDVQNEVSSQSDDIQSKLDDIKDALEQTAANR